MNTNDAGQSFRIPLEGRSAGNNWQPSVLALGGVPLEGEVAAMRFTSATRGYALFNPPSGDSVRPNNGISDLGMVVGHVEKASGGVVKGIALGGGAVEYEQHCADLE